jgi:hypothetical protein
MRYELLVPRVSGTFESSGVFNSSCHCGTTECNPYSVSTYELRYAICGVSHIKELIIDYCETLKQAGTSRLSPTLAGDNVGFLEHKHLISAGRDIRE